MDPQAALDAINDPDTDTDDKGQYIESLDEWRSSLGYKPIGAVNWNAVDHHRLSKYEFAALRRINVWLLA